MSKKPPPSFCDVLDLFQDFTISSLKNKELAKFISELKLKKETDQSWCAQQRVAYVRDAKHFIGKLNAMYIAEKNKVLPKIKGGDRYLLTGLFDESKGFFLRARVEESEKSNEPVQLCDVVKHYIASKLSSEKLSSEKLRVLFGKVRWCTEPGAENRTVTSASDFIEDLGLMYRLLNNNKMLSLTEDEKTSLANAYESYIESLLNKGGRRKTFRKKRQKSRNKKRAKRSTRYRF